MPVQRTLPFDYAGHSVKESRRYDNLAINLVEPLNKVHTRLLHKIKKKYPDLTAPQLKRLNAEIADEINAWYDGSKKSFDKSAEEVAKNEVVWNNRALESYTTAPIISTIYANVVAAGVDAPIMGERTFSQWFSRAGVDDSTRITTMLAGAWAQGLGSAEANRLILGAMKGREHNIKTLTRTYMQHMSAEARDQVFENNDDIIRKKKWISTLDGRTTWDICGIRDQKEYKLDGTPIDHNLPYGDGPGRIHWNCRSIIVPVLKRNVVDMERTTIDPGENYERGDKTTRTGRVRKPTKRNRENKKFEIGEVSSKTDYEKWLREAGEENIEFVQDVVGSKDRARRFMEGESLSDISAHKAVPKKITPPGSATPTRKITATTKAKVVSTKAVAKPSIKEITPVRLPPQAPTNIVELADEKKLKKVLEAEGRRDFSGTLYHGGKSGWKKSNNLTWFSEYKDEAYSYAIELEDFSDDISIYSHTGKLRIAQESDVMGALDDLVKKDSFFERTYERVKNGKMAKWDLFTRENIPEVPEALSKELKKRGFDGAYILFDLDPTSKLMKGGTYVVFDPKDWAEKIITAKPNIRPTKAGRRVSRVVGTAGQKQYRSGFGVDIKADTLEESGKKFTNRDYRVDFGNESLGYDKFDSVELANKSDDAAEEISKEVEKKLDRKFIKIIGVNSDGSLDDVINRSDNLSNVVLSTDEIEKLRKYKEISIVYTNSSMKMPSVSEYIAAAPFNVKNARKILNDGTEFIFKPKSGKLGALGYKSLQPEIRKMVEKDVSSILRGTIYQNSERAIDTLSGFMEAESVNKLGLVQFKINNASENSLLIKMLNKIADKFGDDRIGYIKNGKLFNNTGSEYVGEAFDFIESSAESVSGAISRKYGTGEHIINKLHDQFDDDFIKGAISYDEY